ncbi:MAG: hypothetical protein ACI4EU_04200 [Butyrivibrio sp.]
MLACPGCGGQMKFNIESQDLLCEYCGKHLDPYLYEEGKNAKEEKTFETTVFICPQCGGEIIADDTSAAEFCSFCGASTVLESRISNERRPDYIIPFRMTKEQCKKAYSSYARKNIFAPGKLKNPKYIDSFRGIYMPYWTYDIEQDGIIPIPAKVTYKKSHCLYVDYYEVSTPVKADYKGISYDASSSFDDSISSFIAPYNSDGMKKFVPSILSGFYADTLDVDSEVYLPYARRLAYDISYKKIITDSVFDGLEIEEDKIFPSRDFHLECKDAQISLFPVWFMSYRNKDRVAYAVVNGQTGKVSADMPVDLTKYILGSLILMIPIFLLLEAFLTATPVFMISAASVMAIAMQFIYSKELSDIALKKTRALDRGYMTVEKKKHEEKSDSSDEGSSKMSKVHFTPLFMAVLIVGVIIAIIIHSVFLKKQMPLLQAALTIVSGFAAGKCSEERKNLNESKGFPVFLLSFIAVLTGLIIRLIDPASDMFYYGTAVLIFVTVVMNAIGLIGRHNVLTTRKLPQFNRHGGDDNA